MDLQQDTARMLKGGLAVDLSARHQGTLNGEAGPQSRARLPLQVVLVEFQSRGVLRVELRVPATVAGDEAVLLGLDKHGARLILLVVPDHDVTLHLTTTTMLRSETEGRTRATKMKLIRKCQRRTLIVNYWC